MKAIALAEVATAAELREVAKVVDNNAMVLKKALTIIGVSCIAYSFLDFLKDKQVANEIADLKKRIDILEGRNNEEDKFFEE